jgi:hypothetical protein
VKKSAKRQLQARPQKKISLKKKRRLAKRRGHVHHARRENTKRDQRLVIDADHVASTRTRMEEGTKAKNKTVVREKVIEIAQENSSHATRKLRKVLKREIFRAAMHKKMNAREATKNASSE